MQISELQNGQVVECMTGRGGRTGVEWDGDWHNEVLYVQRNGLGKVRIVTLQSKVWAEASPSDFCPNTDGHGEFVVEDWYLKIKNLTA